MLVKKNKRVKMAKSMKQFYGVMVVFIAICLVVCAFSFQYYRQLHATIRDESQKYLMEVSRRIGSNLDRITEDNFAMLYAMGASLESTEQSSIAEIRELLKKQQNFWNYEKILLVNERGTAYDIGDSGATFFSFDESMRSSLLNGEPAMSNTQIVNNKEYIIFAVPVQQLTVDGERVIALAACYDPAALDQVLSMTSFNDQAYSQIITKSGTAVTRSSASYAIKSGYNMFTTLQGAALDGDSSLEQVQQEIGNDNEGQISFMLNGMHWYMVYTPINPAEWYLLTFVPFQAVNEKSDLLLQSTLQICGIIAATFGGLVTALYFVFSNNRKRLERIAYVDEVTGGNTIQRFYENARVALNEEPVGRFALVYTNIESFKVLNAQLGRKNCDLLLHYFNGCIANQIAETECIGRLSADNFCVLLHYTDEETLLKRLEEWGYAIEQHLREQQPHWSTPATEFGIYVIDNFSLSFPEMIDRAKMALKESHRSLVHKMHCAFYDDKIRCQLVREKQLSDMMEEALANQEFQVYLQPKYKLPEEQIDGAEALVRWVSPTEGMIFPDEFIPLFERNSFIIQLDLWVFEEVCRALRIWCDQGLKPVKVSVNCSRVHFKNPKFLAPYIRIVSQYNIDHSLIEIELTESVVFENTEQLTQIIQEIRSAGFGCSMDDFGSGYSSLNLIQAIPVDTLKIDKIFFRNNDECGRTEAVVQSIVQMAQSLSLTTVAEGVEHREQVEMLKRVGCDYIQGYVFARPMKISAFEELAFGAEYVTEKGDR